MSRAMQQTVCVSSRRVCAAVVALAICSGSASTSLQAADDPWFGRDKALHATTSAGIAAGGYAGSAVVFKTSTTRTRVVSGVAISLGAGAAKEWWDRGRGTPSWRDFAWDGVGAAAGTTIAWLIDRARRRARSDRQLEGGAAASAAVRPTVLVANPACPCP